jgi:hypothetical protein
LLNARDEQQHPLLQEIKTRGLDLDEGMVIVHDGRFHHGKSALRFMAKHGDNQGWLNRINRLLFWSDKLAALVYPWLRGIRNGLLRQRGRPQLDNLQHRKQPIFQDIFGSQWNALPTALKKHYANRPYCRDKVIVEGTMTVEYRSLMRWLRPFYRLIGAVPIESVQNVPVRVEFDSNPHTRAFHFNRTFFFPSAKPYHFRSRMVQISGNEVVEIMRFGVCWCLSYEVEGNKVLLRHRGYALHWFGHFIPLPLQWLLGRGDAEEIALDDSHFAMEVTISHPRFGTIYRYGGEFRVVQTP